MIIDPSADDRLDRAFMALADPVRRRIIARLSRGPATVNELAEPFQITKQAVSKHIQVLEQAGLVTRSRDAQRRPVHLDAAQLEALTAWIDRYRLIHEQQFRNLDALLATTSGADAATSRSRPRGRHRTGSNGIMTTTTNPVTVNAPEGLPFIEIVREFDAPVEAVFRAHRDPELVKQWLGPRGYEMDIERWDFTSQGGYRYVHRNPEGEEYAFNGTFHTVRENEFAVQTFEFEGLPDVVAIESMTFEDLGDGRTRLRIHSTYPTVEARDGMVASGMEGGLREGYERLDAVLDA